MATKAPRSKKVEVTKEDVKPEPPVEVKPDVVDEVDGEEEEVDGEQEEAKEVQEEAQVEAEAEVEEEEEAQDEEEELELFEVEIKGKTYVTNDEVNGDIYEYENDEVGEIVGTFKNGVAKMIKKSKSSQKK